MRDRQERCETCRFWCDPEQLSDHWQECHRYPPSVKLKLAGGDIRDYWPVTWEADFCGEWQPIRPTEAATDAGD